MGEEEKQQAQPEAAPAAAPAEEVVGEFLYMRDEFGVEMVNVLDDTFIPNDISPIFSTYNMYDILNMSIDKVSELLDGNYIDLYTDGDEKYRIEYLSRFDEFIK